MTLQPGCGTCMFGLAGDEVAKPGLIYCRRFPPTPLTSADGKDIVSFFPPMRAEGWCGEFREKAQSFN